MDTAPHTPANQILFGYVRGSTEEQRNTLDAQKAELKAYARRESMDMPDWAIFVDSGTSAYGTNFFEREVVRDMLDTMREQGATQFAVTKLDRAFRNVMDCLSSLEILEKNGFRFHITSLKIDTGSALGKFFLQMTAAVAELENGMRSERQHHAYRAMRASSQRCGAVPYGWDPKPAESGRVSKSGRAAEDLVPNENEQVVLKQILQMRSENMTYAAIAQHLNAECIPSKNAGELVGGKVCSGAWHGSTVQKVVKHAERMAAAEEVT